MKTNILLLLFLCLIFFKAQSKSNFEKKVWLYWEKDFQRAPLMVQLCYSKIQSFAQKNQYQLNLVTDANLQEYITNYNDYRRVLRRSERGQNAASKSDLIRMTLLSQHGGIWFDISAILLDQFELKWLDNIDQYSNIIVNKYTESVDVLMFTYGKFQSTVINRNWDGKLYNDIPGFQIWFVAAAKNSQLIQDWKNIYYNFTVQGEEQYHKWISEKDVFMRHIDNNRNRAYWCGNIALMYAINKKQMQLDKLTTPFSRKNVFQYYKLWSIHGQMGPLYTAHPYTQHQRKLFDRSLKQIEQQDGKIHFFIKLNHNSRQSINSILLNSIQRFVIPNITFSQYISNSQNKQSCNDISFIIQDSPIYELLSPQDRIRYKNLIITKEQRTKWQHFCPDYYKNEVVEFSLPNYGELTNFEQFMNYLVKLNKWRLLNVYSQEHMSRASLIRLYNQQNISLSQYLTEYIKINRMCIIGFFFFIPMIITVFLWILLTYNFAQCLMKIIASICKIQLENESDDYTSNFHNLSDQIQNHEKLPKKSYFILISTGIMLISFGLTLIFIIQLMGIYPIPLETLVYAIFIAFYNNFVRKYEDQHKETFFNLSLNNWIIILRTPNYYFLGYLVISLGQRRDQFIIMHTVILTIVVSCLINLYDNLSQKFINNKQQQTRYQLIKNVKIFKGTYIYLVIAVLLVNYLIPNLRWITLNDKYVSFWAIKTLTLYPIILGLLLSYEIFKYVVFIIKSKSLLETLTLIKIILLFVSVMTIYIQAFSIDSTYHATFIAEAKKFFYHFYALGMLYSLYLLSKKIFLYPKNIMLKIAYRQQALISTCVQISMILFWCLGYFNKNKICIESEIFPDILLLIVKILTFIVFSLAFYSLFYHKNPEKEIQIMNLVLSPKHQSTQNIKKIKNQNFIDLKDHQQWMSIKNHEQSNI